MGNIPLCEPATCGDPCNRVVAEDIQIIATPQTERTDAEEVYTTKGPRRVPSCFEPVKAGESAVTSSLLLTCRPPTRLLAGPAYEDPDDPEPVAFMPPRGYKIFDFLSRTRGTNSSGGGSSGSTNKSTGGGGLNKEKQVPFLVCVDSALNLESVESKYDRFQFRLSWVTGIRTAVNELEGRSLLPFLANALGFNYEEAADAKENVWKFIRAMQLVHNYMILFPTASAARDKKTMRVRVDLSFDSWANIKKAFRENRENIIVPEQQGEGPSPKNSCSISGGPDLENSSSVSGPDLENLLQCYVDRYPILAPAPLGEGDDARVLMVNFVAVPPGRNTLANQAAGIAGREFDEPLDASSVYGAFLEEQDHTSADEQDGEQGDANRNSNLGEASSLLSPRDRTRLSLRKLKLLGRAFTVHEMVAIAGSMHDLQDYEDKAHYLAAASNADEENEVREILSGFSWYELFAAVATLTKNKLTGDHQPIQRLQRIRTLYQKHASDVVSEKKARLERMCREGATHSCITYICRLAHALGAKMNK
ncbi:unnamed protein product [Amoebophrya sp. A25]|nr:unnamed protein product [Amoebophrya sp. A25]|eukprot:GSA25T00019748001.1